MVARSIAVENEATRLVASNKYGSSLGLVRVGSKERRAKILSREEREEIERERERERVNIGERYGSVNKQIIKKIATCYNAVP